MHNLSIQFDEKPATHFDWVIRLLQRLQETLLLSCYWYNYTAVRKKISTRNQYLDEKNNHTSKRQTNNCKLWLIRYKCVMVRDYGLDFWPTSLSKQSLWEAARIITISNSRRFTSTYQFLSSIGLTWTCRTLGAVIWTVFVRWKTAWHNFTWWQLCCLK